MKLLVYLVLKVNFNGYTYKKSSAEAAKDFVADHADSVKDGITKAGDFVDEKSGGKLSAGVDKAQDAASNLVDKFKK
jgi:hypothetical protein